MGLCVGVCQLFCIFAVAKAKNARGVAQLVSAPRSGRGGRKFESSHPDNKRQQIESQSVAFCFILKSRQGTQSLTMIVGD